MKRDESFVTMLEAQSSETLQERVLKEALDEAKMYIPRFLPNGSDETGVWKRIRAILAKADLEWNE